MPDFTELAEMQFARLTIARQCALARRVFYILEYDSDGDPGAEWSSDTTQALGELFGNYDITFTAPDSVPTTYRYNDHRTRDGNPCPHALQSAPPPIEWAGNAGPPWCPNGCLASTIEGGTPEPEPWPPTGREPTAGEIANGSAVHHDDGSTSWSPTNSDADWTDTAELRASGHPAGQAADYEPPELRAAQAADADEQSATAQRK